MPTLTIRCPNCSKALKAPRQLIGRRVKCPKCGGRVSIADPDAADGDASPADVAEDDAAAARSTIAETRQRETAAAIAQRPAPEPPPRPRPAAEPATPPKPVTTAEKPPHARRLPGWMTRPVIIASAVGLIVGYMAGREHLKYQMRAALRDAGEAMREAFAGGLGAGESTASAATASIGTPAEPEAPPLTIGQTYDGGPFTLALLSARIGHATINSTFGDGTVETDKRYLILRFRVANTDDRKILNFYGGSMFDGGPITVRDDVDNHIRGVSFGITELAGAIQSTDDIQPGDERQHVEVFTVPPAKTEFLIVTVDLGAFGGSGRVQFKIAGGEIPGLGADPT